MGREEVREDRNREHRVVEGMATHSVSLQMIPSFLSPAQAPEIPPMTLGLYPKPTKTVSPLKQPRNHFPYLCSSP